MTKSVVAKNWNGGYSTWSSDGSQRTWAQPSTGLWLPSGHFTPAKVPFTPLNQSATQIHPRPDSETNSYAFHRNHYYDGTTAFIQRIPIVARGGAFPYNFVLMDAPAAANAVMDSASWTPGWLPGQASSAGYGDLLVQPSGSYTNARFWVRVYDQQYNYIDFIWTASTIGGYDATNQKGFIFLDPLNGVDAGSYPSSGIIATAPAVGTPLKTLSWVFGATGGTATYPNAYVVCLGTANVPLYAQDAAYGIQIESGKTPMGVIGMPGQTVTLDASTAGTHDAWDVSSSGCNDLFFQNFSEINRPTTVNFRHIASLNSHNRFTLHNVSFPNLMVGTDPTDNAGPVYFDNPGTNLRAYRQYVAIKGMQVPMDATVDSMGANGFACFDGYHNQYLCIELCQITGFPGGTSGNGIIDLKSSNQDTTVRCNFFSSSSTGTGDLVEALDFFDGAPSQRQEWCYNIIDNSPHGGSAAILNFNTWQLSNYQVGVTWSYRNTLVDGTLQVGAPTGNGPFISENDAIQYNTGAQAVLVIGSGGGTLPGTLTNNGGSSGTSRAQASTGVFNSDYTFQSGFTAYNGTDGALIG